MSWEKAGKILKTVGDTTQKNMMMTDQSGNPFVTGISEGKPKIGFGFGQDLALKRALQLYGGKQELAAQYNPYKSLMDMYRAQKIQEQIKNLQNKNKKGSGSIGDITIEDLRGMLGQ